MPSLIPRISLAVGVVCFLLALHLFAARRANNLPSLLLGAILGVFALQSALLVLLIDYERPHWAAVLRPSLATTIGPLVFLYFKSVADAAFQWRAGHGFHFAPALFVGLELYFGVYPIDVDLAIITSFAGYALAVGLMLRRGDDLFGHLGDNKQSMFFILAATVCLLAVSVISEILISLDIARGGMLESSAPLFITLVCNLAVASAAVLVVLHRPSPFERQYAFAGAVNAEETPSRYADYTQCIARFENLMRSERLYADENADLASTAKRLGVPRRHLSEAINVVYGESYSRRMNRLRIEEAKRLIRACPEKSMTDVMFDAGFRTKSSFNREFRAIEGRSPTQYRTEVGDDTVRLRV